MGREINPYCKPRFLTEVDPGNYTRVQFEQDLCGCTAAATNRPADKIPKFKCCYSSPFQYITEEDKPGQRLTSKSYNMETRQRDAKVMITLLKQTFLNNPTFMFHWMQHTLPQVYSNTIWVQNKYLSNTHVIPIAGVTCELMFYLSSELLQIEGVTHVLEHSKTDTEG